jgi:hypothetical protein
VLKRTLWLGLLCVAVWACNDTVVQRVFDTRIVDGSNGNPVAGTDATILMIGVQQGDLPAEEDPFPIEDGQFDAVLELSSAGLLTRVRVEVELQPLGGAASVLRDGAVRDVCTRRRRRHSDR